MRRFIAILIIFLALFVAAPSLKAQDLSDQLRIEHPTRRLELDISAAPWDIPAPRENFLAETTQRHYAPGELVIDYRGFQEAIVRRMQSQFSRLWDRSLRNYEPDQLEKAIYSRGCLWQDFEAGRWWERTWRESLEEEKGGAGDPITYHVGQVIEVFNLHGITLSNDGKITTGEFRLRLDTVRDKELEPTSEPATIRSTRVTGGIQINSLLHTQYYDITFRPMITFKGTIVPKNILSSLSVDTRVRIYQPGRSKPIASLVVSAEGNPLQAYYSVRFGLEIFVW